MTRAAGLLLHPTSLPGPFGIGDLGPSAVRFLDWAAGAGQTLWQVLPLGPTGFGNSPYCLLSAFAGNPLLISPELLVSEGLLPGAFLEGVPRFDDAHVRFGEVVAFKKTMCRSAFARFRLDAPRDLREALAGFTDADEQRGWLDDWCLFAALKSKHGRREWTTWPEGLRDREPRALEAARRELAPELEYRAFVQFLFFRQWTALRAEAGARGISILGDIPIYVAGDSADTWAHRRLFAMGQDGAATEVAGVPPDYFSPDGQLWGNPLFRWDRVAEEGFSWWIDRVRANLGLFDLLRIDHFRGFATYWAVPAGETTARRGAWRQGPGLRLFAAIGGALGEVPFVAEDLGDIDDGVRELLLETGLPGMKVLQFAFFEDDHEFQPHNVVRNSVVYTGTHDNDTTVGWWRELNETDRKRVRDYVGPVPDEIGWELIRTAATTVADRVIVPVQDVFCLGSEARMNTPGREAENWTWRARGDDFTEARSAGLRRLAELTGRFVTPPAAAADAPAGEAGGTAGAGLAEEAESAGS